MRLLTIPQLSVLCYEVDLTKWERLFPGTYAKVKTVVVIASVCTRQ